MSDLPDREAMEFDVVVVGAGPAGLSAAIRLKQLNPELAVVLVEKGSEVGAHILSGAVIDPIGLDRLLPEWRGEDTPIKTPVTEDRFYWLGPAGGLRVPNHVCYRFGDDAVCSNLDCGGQVDRCGRHRQVELEIVAEGAGELTDRIDETEMVERGRPEIADDSFHFDHECVDLVGNSVEQFA